MAFMRVAVVVNTYFISYFLTFVHCFSALREYRGSWYALIYSGDVLQVLTGSINNHRETLQKPKSDQLSWVGLRLDFNSISDRDQGQFYIGPGLRACVHQLQNYHLYHKVIL